MALHGRAIHGQVLSLGMKDRLVGGAVKRQRSLPTSTVSLGFPARISHFLSLCDWPRIANPTNLRGIWLKLDAAVKRRSWTGMRHDSERIPVSSIPSTACSLGSTYFCNRCLDARSSTSRFIHDRTAAKGSEGVFRNLLSACRLACNNYSGDEICLSVAAALLPVAVLNSRRRRDGTGSRCGVPAIPLTWPCGARR